MRLSEARRELLKRNRGRIRLLLRDIDDLNDGPNCKYEYSDGTLCVASAALSDLERAEANPDVNTYQFRTLNKDYIINGESKNEQSILNLCALRVVSMTREDIECLYQLQRLHDRVFRTRYEEDKEEFLDALNKAIKGEEVDEFDYTL